MKRGTKRAFITVIFAVAVLLLANTLLYGDDGDSKNFSRPITPETPDGESESIKPFTSGKRLFSDSFMPRLDKNLFSSNRDKGRFKIQEWTPDSRIHYFIAELMVRQDIDYKILNVIDTNR